MNNKKFFEYCYYGRNKEVKKYINNGFDVNYRSDYWGDTPLFGVGLLDYEIVEKLLELGADPNMKNKINLTPLICLVINGFNEEVFKKLELLLSWGADIDCEDVRGKTFYYYCKNFKEEDKEKIKGILEMYKDVNLKPARD